MNEPTLLDYLTAIGSVATPLLVLALTALGWTIRNRYERVRALEEKLREDRITTYTQILEPFIVALSSEKIFAKDKKLAGKSPAEVAFDMMMNLDYRNMALKLTLVGSDSVVKAYNNLMQYIYKQNRVQAPSEDSGLELMLLLGAFILEVRRGFGNENTSMEKLEMLEWLITDIRKYRN